MVIKVVGDLYFREGRAVQVVEVQQLRDVLHCCHGPNAKKQVKARAVLSPVSAAGSLPPNGGLEIRTRPRIFHRIIAPRTRGEARHGRV